MTGQNLGSGPGRLVQVGVTAWGVGQECGQEGVPSVYSSVISARCWLDQIMSCYPVLPFLTPSFIVSFYLYLCNGIYIYIRIYIFLGK